LIECADYQPEVVEHDLKRVRTSVDSPTAFGTPTSIDRGSFAQLSSPIQGPATTFSTSTSQPVRDIYRIRDPGEAVRILQEVPIPLFHTLVDLWFKECQPWLPVLNRSKLEQSLAELTVPVERIDDIVLRALIALSLNHSTAAIRYGYNGRRQVASHLRAEVLIEAMAKVSLESLQALLIIAVMVSQILHST
jgi:hypothetical protein